MSLEGGFAVPEVEIRLVRWEVRVLISRYPALPAGGALAANGGALKDTPLCPDSFRVAK